MAARPDHPDSLWAATAAAAPPASPLDGDRDVDVAVVGAGYCGLAAALHLAERGTDVAVIEAAEIGWGASGRNGGQVNPGLRPALADIAALHGEEAARRLVQAADEAPDALFALIARLGFDCGASRPGALFLAHTPAMLDLYKARAERGAKAGLGTRFLDKQAAAALLGSDRYCGGYVDPRGGQLNPLSLARGLAAAAIRRGAAVHVRTPALSLAREGTGDAARWAIATPRGRLRARAVILATNAYTDGLWPGLRETVLPVNSFQIATTPLDESQRRAVLPQSHAAADSRRLILYFRKDPEGRLVIGGRASFTTRDRPVEYGIMKRVLQDIFPQLGNLRVAHGWAGTLAITWDRLPHLHEPAPGVLAGLGFNGKGVALATVMGRVLAERALGASAASLPFPTVPVAPIPLHRFRQPILHLAMQWNLLMDRIGR
ncbi:MAG: FAD-binding oxidoreductase [Alphaproteobacteria bacterium]|nr:FAD-binding oxidoreductase [Alphaproteobacteria bacterium]